MGKKKRDLHGPEAVAKAKRNATRQGPVVSLEGGSDKGNVNLFERLWNRKKFDIVGKKVKGEQRALGKARTEAVEKRKNTLLREFKERYKSNAFLDHRFGESTENLDEEDKAILRFQKERQSQLNKKSKFNLEDAGEEEILTHKGAPLSSMDDFKEEIDNERDEDDDELLKLDAEMVRELHFGGGEFSEKNKKSTKTEDGERPKSKKEAMAELIAKSKFYKAQKQKEKEEDELVRERLDSDFRQLSQSDAMMTLFRPTKKETSKKVPEENAEEKDHKVKEEDDYESLAKSLVFELRAHAGERTKTAEELAEEQREILLELERNQKRRMAGELSSEEEGESGGEEGENEGEDGGKGRKKRKKAREISGDDLGENFALDDSEDEGKKGWVDEILAKGGESEDESGEESEEEEEESDNSGEENLSEEEESEEDKDKKSKILSIFEGAQESESDGEEVQVNGKKGQEAEESNGKAKEVSRKLPELPYVIGAPKNLAEFQSLVEGRTDAELAEAIHRIRTCNAISLAPENRKKMQIFYGILLQYFASTAGKVPLQLSRLDTLTPHLIEMTAVTPLFAAVCARERILKIHQSFNQRLKEVPDNDSLMWSALPTPKELLLLQLWSLIFPPSDFRHPVMTPALLLSGEFLSRCPIRSLRDVAIGLFTCSLLLQMVRDSKRFCPEALTFLHSLLRTSIPREKVSAVRIDLVIPEYMTVLVSGKSWLTFENNGFSPEMSSPLSFSQIISLDPRDPHLNSDDFRLSLLAGSLLTLTDFTLLYKELPSFPEVFGPFLHTLSALSEVSLSGDVEQVREKLVSIIKSGIKETETTRQPLRMRVKKAVPIKQYNPRFEENFEKGRDYDIDKERSERKKLQKMLKKETRGAVRELRKDNYFLAEEKRKEQQIAEEETTEKYKKTMAFLQEQEHAFKSGQLGGKKKRRR